MAERPFISSIQKLMGASVSQQRAAAKNIANQNTPGYRRIEVDFREVLRSVNNTQTVKLEGTKVQHLAALRDRQAEQVKAVDSGDPIEEGKVNNVDLDTEMGVMAKTQLYYQVLTRVMRGRFQKLNNSITGQTR
ncbi:MAG: flagellar basal body rod protein FlgB [Candidatus Marinimicrobia bacterium]|nr:flagellar basal body rod protein FlgB [Candidatus Neomarinimicrobiota bacterium]MCF7880493.1 flagellar basal body rod protein FlgB [Candidatus Neomarinimicrobiota bacterium]